MGLGIPVKTTSLMQAILASGFFCQGDKCEALAEFGHAANQTGASIGDVVPIGVEVHSRGASVLEAGVED